VESPPAASRAGVGVGSTARVASIVACGWRSPDAPRPLDASAIAARPDIAGWLAGMTDDDKRGLVGRLDTQALLGDAAEILERTPTWARVALASQPTGEGSGGYAVWMPIAQLAAATPEPSGAEAVHATVTAPIARLGVAATRMDVSLGTSLPAIGRTVNGVEVRLPSGEVGSLAATDVVVHATGQPALEPEASSIVRMLRSFLGLPYLWAGASGFGFDCSGLVHVVHRVHGIRLPRDTGPMSEVGTLIPPADRKPGDLVFFERDGDVHHVVTWLGDGRVIESPKTGLAVREIELDALPYAHEVTVTRRILDGA
jgi:cell wall-associated NlpC family hydrolase